MKKFNLFAMSLMALLMACFTACDNNNVVDVDHSADLVGTWTCLTANYAEALVINADGTMLSTGVENGEYWENVAGNIVIKNGIATMTFEDDDNFEGHIDVVPGVAFYIHNEDGEQIIYNYCKEDLADEVVGMWVCTEEVFGQEEDAVAVNTFTEDGKSYLTAFLPDANGYITQAESNYKVVGNLLIGWTKATANIPAQYLVLGLDIIPNGTEFGDVMTHYNTVYNTKATFIRIKQTLDLADKKYDYIKTYITNVDGLDKDIKFMDYTFNFAKIDGVKFDKMLKTLLFAVEFPSADTIKYSCHYNNEAMALQAPIVVDGNKMTVKMSEVYPAAKDVDLYTFQDQDNSQMHMYMPTYAFINFFGNMQIAIMAQLKQLDMNDAAAVKAVFDSIDEAVNTINVSFVMTSSK